MTFTQEQREEMRAAIRKRLREEDLMRGEIVRLLGFSVRSEDLPKILEACRESDRASMAEAARDLATFESESEHIERSTPCPSSARNPS